MSYSILLENKLEKRLSKLYGQDKSTHDRLINKMIELSQEPRLGKPLRKDLKGKWRVHIGHFVLIYQINESRKTITFLEFEHHDSAYK